MPTESSRPTEILKMLKDALEHLAAGAPQQREYLQQIGVDGCADELALEFDDVFRMLGEAHQAGVVSRAQGMTAMALSEYLDAMSGEPNAALWNAEALESSVEWHRVRELAEEALFAFGFIQH